MNKQDLIDAMNHINPGMVSYEEWCQVGMALKHEGFPCAVWTDWSAQDSSRFHNGECEKKWASFREQVDKPVTAGTLVKIAYTHGWVPPQVDDHAMGWNEAVLVTDTEKRTGIIDRNWLEGREVIEPQDSEWNPADDLIKYLEVLFQPEEIVGYCCESYQRHNDERWTPAGSGIYVRTAGEIITKLKLYRGDSAVIGKALGDYNQECGAWIRFNPLNGEGVKNANVTDFRYALIESDKLSIEKQNEIIHKLELPVAALVTSGNKSLHAIVHVDAGSYTEYRKRVDALYKICQENGLELDPANRNPSRLSRMPGVMRAGKKQFLVETNIGKESWEKWQEWYAEQNDDLPDFENLADEWENLPELAPPLIDGILRQGHKMLLSGPSKAGKSFLQIEMAIAVAEGLPWLGWNCAQGTVIYVNFELDRASCLHRFKDVYEALGIEPKNLRNIDIWNLRGKSLPMDQLAPKLIRRARKENPIAIILDPIYKVITGDENSADQMARFCNQFDKVCTEVGCSVIYCHHHSKGAQGSKKAMDRASGSGVFARDPDALIDIIELPLKDEQYENMKADKQREIITQYLDTHVSGWRNRLPDEHLSDAFRLSEYCKKNLYENAKEELFAQIAESDRHVEHTTAWRVSCTLREFEKADNKDIFFSWPIHRVDESGMLAKIRPDIEINGKTIHQRDVSDGSHKAEKLAKERQQIIDAYTLIAAEKDPNKDGVVVVNVRDFIKRSEEFFNKKLARSSMYKKLQKFGDFTIERGDVFPNHDSDDYNDDFEEENED